MLLVFYNVNLVRFVFVVWGDVANKFKTPQAATVTEIRDCMIIYV